MVPSKEKIFRAILIQRHFQVNQSALASQLFIISVTGEIASSCIVTWEGRGDDHCTNGPMEFN